jgi:hypothetical protein
MRVLARSSRTFNRIGQPVSVNIQHGKNKRDLVVICRTVFNGALQAASNNDQAINPVLKATGNKVKPVITIFGLVLIITSWDLFSF